MFRVNREFQAGLNQTEARRRRENNSLSLRRKERETKLQNKRKKILHKIQNETSSQTPETKANEQQQMQRLLCELPRFVKGIFKEHKSTIYECVKKIRLLLSFSCNAVPIQQVVESGVISRVIKFLYWNDAPRIQFESMWVLTNITSSETQYTALVVRNGALDALNHVLKIQKYPLQEQAVWAIGNIAGDCLELRNQVLQSNTLSLLLNICKAPLNKASCFHIMEGENNCNTALHQYVSLLSNLSWTISNLCRTGRHDMNYVPILVKCAYYIFKNKESLPDGIPTLDIDLSFGWTFCYLTANENVERDSSLVNEMYRIGITGDLIQLFATPNYRPCLKVIGNILAGHDVYTQQCIDSGLLPLMYRLLQTLSAKNHDVVANGELKELCWCISNICAGSTEQVLLVQKHKIFPIATQLIRSRSQVVAKEALWIVANALENGHKGVITHLVDDCKVIEAVCNFNKRFLSNGYQENMELIVIVSLDCIENILSVNSQHYADEFETNDGLDFLEALQCEQLVPQDIYSRAVNIIQEWFGGEMEGQHAQSNGKNDVDIRYSGDNMYRNQFGFGFNRNENNLKNHKTTNRYQF